MLYSDVSCQVKKETYDAVVFVFSLGFGLDFFMFYCFFLFMLCYFYGDVYVYACFGVRYLFAMLARVIFVVLVCVLLFVLYNN